MGKASNRKRSHQVPEHPCPLCGAPLNVAAEIRKMNSDGPVPGAATPSPGDFTVCSYCAIILRYGEGLTLHLLAPSDRDEIRQDPAMRAQLAAMVAHAHKVSKEEGLPTPRGLVS